MWVDPVWVAFVYFGNFVHPPSPCLFLEACESLIESSVCVSASQHGAVGGEDPQSFGPASEGRQRLLRPVRQDLPTARQEEEIPDQGASHSQNTHLYPGC